MIKIDLFEAPKGEWYYAIYDDLIKSEDQCVSLNQTSPCKSEKEALISAGDALKKYAERRK